MVGVRCGAHFLPAPRLLTELGVPWYLGVHLPTLAYLPKSLATKMPGNVNHKCCGLTVGFASMQGKTSELKVPEVMEHRWNT